MTLFLILASVWMAAESDATQIHEYVACDGEVGRITADDEFWYDPTPEERANGVEPIEGAVGIQYLTDGSAEDCCWIQFVFATVGVRWVDSEGGRRATLIEGEIPGNSGTLTLTTDGDDLNWLLDTMSPPHAVGPQVHPGDRGSPCYDRAGASIRTPNSVVMIDLPGGFLEAGVQAQTLEQYPNAELVLMGAMFHSYLVCDGEVCARVTWVAKWRWTPNGGFSDAEYTVRDIQGPPVGLLPEQWETLNARYPDQTDVRRTR